MLLLYATRDGQSRRIAEHIAAWLAASEITVRPQDLACAVPAPADLAAAGLVVVVAAVRYGRHLPQAERFFSVLGAVPTRVQLVLLSVNLTARKPGKDTEAGNPYLRKAIARHRLEPVLAAAVAGRLDYKRCGWLDKQMIRLIMRMTGGPTDPQTCIEFTVWKQVDEIARRIARLHAAAAGRSPREIATRADPGGTAAGQ